MKTLLTCTVGLLVSGSTPAARCGAPVEKPRAIMRAHLVDYASMSADEVRRATTEASEIWSDIGVRLLWDPNGATVAGLEPSLAVTVLVLRQDMAERMIAAEHRDPGVLARAVPEALRVYIFYNRVRAVGERYGGPQGSVLGKVFAHELGHLLLGHTHSSSGLMRAQPDLKSTGLGFSPDDGARIRAGITQKIAASEVPGRPLP